MPNIFRSFERFGLRTLLISGQASILYGAATFSEDVDLWVDPSPENIRRLRRALAAVGARVYKLTPPLTAALMRAGHGFHFTIGAKEPLYLDVMGRPPRVGPFGEARRRAGLAQTPWGRVPLVAIEDLVAMKKTRRLPDYEVISNLVEVRLRRSPPPPARWAIENTFRAEDLARLVGRWGPAGSRRPAALLLARRPGAVEPARQAIAAEIAGLQAADTAYWRRRLAQIRRLRESGLLLPEGSPVSPKRRAR